MMLLWQRFMQMIEVTGDGRNEEPKWKANHLGSKTTLDWKTDGCKMHEASRFV